MYWPSVQDDVSASASAVARGAAICVAPRLFGRPALLDMKDLRFDAPSGLLMQPISALLQPITDKLSRHVQNAAAIFNQSKLTSAVYDRKGMVEAEPHENSACTR